MFQTQNPYTLAVLGNYQYLSENQVENCLVNALGAWNLWRKSEIKVRQLGLMNVATELRKFGPRLALLMSQEMGKPIGEALAEVEKCAASTEHIAQNFPAWLAIESVKAHSTQCFIEKESLGPILCIMPWNFPLWQVIRFAVPALAAGNVVLLKGSDLTAGTSQLLSEVFGNSFQVVGVFQNFQVSHEQAAKAIADQRVRAVTFTGSPVGGRQVAEVAGRNLKKVVLELGGNDPYILLDDCDLERSAKLCAQSRLLNTGQSCIAAKRFFVPRQLRDPFVQVFSASIAERRCGDPQKPETDLGVLAHHKFKARLESQVDQLKSRGAKLLWASDHKSSGAFFNPLILEADLNLGEAHQQELFGPVALCFFYDEIDSAIRAANSSPFGLGAGVFSQNPQRASVVAQQLEVGMVAINDFVKSDARLPFGGVKDSGFGRELSQHGFAEFLNLKVSWGQWDQKT
jgi:succinate-semialdehyde dehydrogenase/glutarate-semialdehyde dehydrogenase